MWNVGHKIEDLQGLLDNSLGAVVIADFLPPEEAESILTLIMDSDFQGYFHLPFRFMKCGPAQSEFFRDPLGEEKYIATAFEWRSANRELNSVRENLLSRVSELIGGSFSIKCDAVKDKRGEFYTAGIFRESNGIPLHSDWVPRDAPENWPNIEIHHQIALNIFLSCPKHGGELCVYDMPWMESLEFYKLPKFGYSREIVKGSRNCLVKPNVGDIIMFNCRNFHEVLPSDCREKRVSFGLHIGVYGGLDSDVIVWS